MFYSLLPLLRCPDGGELELSVTREELHAARNEQDVIEGILTSKRTGKVYPITNGIPRLLPHGYDSDTQSRFEREWKVWGAGSKIYGMDKQKYKEDLFQRRSGHTLNDEFFRGKIVLEGGCGHGMAGEILATSAKEYIGLDLGSGIDVARARTKHLPNVHLVQGSILTAPFSDACADVVFSIGVIHHIPDPKSAFQALVRVNKPGGLLLIWVYPKEGIIWETVNPTVRAITTRLPERAVYSLAGALVPLMYVVQPYAHTRPSENSWRENMQSLYDWLAPKYQYHYSPEELSQWFKESGYSDMCSAPTRTGISGVKGS